MSRRKAARAHYSRFDPYAPDLWDRPSTDIEVRPNRVILGIRKDLLLPIGPSVPKMLVLTFAAGVSMTILYAFLPLLILVIATGHQGLTSAWFWGTLLVIAVGCWLTMFALAIRESIADRRYADSL